MESPDQKHEVHDKEERERDRLKKGVRKVRGLGDPLEVTEVIVGVPTHPRDRLGRVPGALKEDSERQHETTRKESERGGSGDLRCRLIPERPYWSGPGSV